MILKAHSWSEFNDETETFGRDNSSFASVNFCKEVGIDQHLSYFFLHHFFTTLGQLSYQKFIKLWNPSGHCILNFFMSFNFGQSRMSILLQYSSESGQHAFKVSRNYWNFFISFLRCTNIKKNCLFSDLFIYLSIGTSLVTVEPLLSNILHL
jgi:hypothetical protein